jgi:hypothetical protein
MMRMISVVLLGVLLSSVSIGQLKSKVDAPPSVSSSLTRPVTNDFLLGLFDPSAFSMRHSFSMSYTSFGGQGLSLGTYTNSMSYQFSDALDVQADVSLMHSPYNSLGKDAQSQLSGLFLSRAQLSYRPTDNMWLQIQYRQLPPMYWMGNYRSPYFYGIDRYDGDYR